jgi:effector-binding domain-containing protein
VQDHFFRIFNFSLLTFWGFLGQKQKVENETLKKIFKNSKMNSMDFKYPYPLAIVRLRVLKKDRRFYHNYAFRRACIPKVGE